MQETHSWKKWGGSKAVCLCSLCGHKYSFNIGFHMLSKHMVKVQRMIAKEYLNDKSSLLELAKKWGCKPGLVWSFVRKVRKFGAEIAMTEVHKQTGGVRHLPTDWDESISHPLRTLTASPITDRNLWNFVDMSVFAERQKLTQVFCPECLPRRCKVNLANIVSHLRKNIGAHHSPLESRVRARPCSLCQKMVLPQELLYHAINCLKTRVDIPDNIGPVDGFSSQSSSSQLPNTSSSVNDDQVSIPAISGESSGNSFVPTERRSSSSTTQTPLLPNGNLQPSTGMASKRVSDQSESAAGHHPKLPRWSPQVMPYTAGDPRLKIAKYLLLYLHCGFCVCLLCWGALVDIVNLV